MPFFFDENQFVSLSDKMILAQNLETETFLRYQYNPFLEDQRAELSQKSQQHYLVIRIHLVPDEDIFADLLEQLTRQCLILSQQRSQQWHPDRFFELFNQQKQDAHAFCIQTLQEDNSQNRLNTTSQQNWKVKQVCIDRVMFHVAPDMTLQAIRAGRDQDVIQSLASNASQAFSGKPVTPFFLEPPVLFSEQVHHSHRNLLQYLALKPKQTLLPSMRYSALSGFSSQEGGGTHVTSKKIEQNSVVENDREEEDIRKGVRLRMFGMR